MRDEVSGWEGPRVGESDSKPYAFLKDVEGHMRGLLGMPTTRFDETNAEEEDETDRLIALLGYPKSYDLPDD